MKKFRLYCQLALVFMFISACSTHNSLTVSPSKLPNNLYFDDYFIDYTEVPIESEQEVFAIDADMKEMVRTKLLTEKDPFKRAKKLLIHLFSKEDINLAYQNSANLTARQAFHSQTANCMSLTIMSYVLAKEAGLEVEFQDIEIPEYWVRSGSYNMLTGHVNLLIKRPIASNVAIMWGKKALQIDFDPFVVKDSFPKKKVDRTTILAMFYTNKGGQAMAEGRYVSAYAYLKAATQVSPYFPSSWSNLGILYRLVNNYDLAEKTYRYALALDPDNLTILDNLAILMKKQGFIIEANKIEESLHFQRIKNPYYHALLGDEALYRGDPIAAKHHFKRAIHLNNRAHEFYYGLAKVYYQLDEYKKAEMTLNKAIKFNRSRNIERQYIAKLNFIQASSLNE